MQAVNRKVEMMSEKNLEKGLHMDSVDKDARNAVIQQAIKALPSRSPRRSPQHLQRSPGVPWPRLLVAV
ncbi:Zinc finger protein 622 [Plecturocebus cupreus]